MLRALRAQPWAQGVLSGGRAGTPATSQQEAGREESKHPALGEWLQRETRKINRAREPPRPRPLCLRRRRHRGLQPPGGPRPRAPGASHPGPARCNCASERVPGARLAGPPRPAEPLGRDRAPLCSFRWPSTIVLLEIMNSIPIKGH
uniref:Uncharacterized protein n=1 Tax=Rangifer tarandus platyrhynchus TaxID=3082113 RepID=A0ACB0E757_RANTA|nr:unnamed protein product [Rangifer tarandus platyrhynchus]